MPIVRQAAPIESPFMQAWARRETLRLDEERARARNVESSTSQEDDQRRVREATASTWHWMSTYTRTTNPHWKEEGYASPEEPFPNWPYFQPMLELLESEEPVICIEKSRDMMASWACVAYFTLQAMTVPGREIVFQNLEQEKSWELVSYAKQLWRSQPKFLRDAFPLTKDVDAFSKSEIAFRNGSAIWGIPGGKDKIRMFHPWGYLNDETAFQPEAGDCYDNALAACVKIVLNSTANAGWYQMMKSDANL